MPTALNRASARAWSTVRRRSTRASQLAMTFAKYGPTAAYHLLTERRAAQGARRADIKPHLGARLNAIGAQNGTALHAALVGVGCTTCTGLTAEAVEQDPKALDERLDLVSLEDLASLYTYFRYFGDYRLAQFLRNAVLRKELSLQSQRLRLSLSALAAAWELGRFGQVIELAAVKRSEPQDALAVRQVTAFAHALCGDSAKATQLWSQDIGSLDADYRQAIKGKTIAVVGPAPPVADQRSEIDTYDVIVRTNYQGKTDPRCGTRTDVSYYNSHRIAKTSEDILAIASSLDWIISTRGRDEELRRLLPPASRTRSSNTPQSHFYDATPLAVPIILSDLMRFEPKQIKLFNSDFFNSRISYSPGYHPTPVSAASLSHSLRIHDPFSSFRFVQLMMQAGLMTADPIAEKVLSQSQAQYARSLEDLYGAHEVANTNPRLNKSD